MWGPKWKKVGKSVLFCIFGTNPKIASLLKKGFTLIGGETFAGPTAGGGSWWLFSSSARYSLWEV